MADLQAYATRIDATNFALAADDGAVTADYARADVILIGVSRSGKTPTCIYMAMQYGIFAANYPLTEDDFEGKQLPAPLRTQTAKLFGLTIAPSRLTADTQRAPAGSRYASLSQCEYEVRSAEGLFQRLRHTTTEYDRMLDRGNREPCHRPQGDRTPAAAVIPAAAVCRASRLREIAVL